MPRLLAAFPLALVLVLALPGASPALAARTTKVVLDTAPTGAEVLLVTADGETSLGHTPLTARLPRGQVTLLFRLAGYEELLETRTIGNRSTQLVFSLNRAVAPGTLELLAPSGITGAQVSVDGKAMGTLPKTLELPPGRHLAEVKAEGYEPWERWVTLTEGQKLSIEVPFKALAKKSGSVLVSTTPSRAEVFLGGKLAGVTPLVLRDLEPGEHLVRLSLAGHAVWDGKASVTAGKQVVLDVALQAVTPGQVAPPGGTLPGGVRPATPGGTGQVAPPENAHGNARLRVDSDVPEATVRIDGGSVHPVPHVADDLRPGTHTIEVLAPGKAPWKRTVTLKAGDSESLVASFTAEAVGTHSSQPNAELRVGTLDVDTVDGAAADVFVDGKNLGKTPLTVEQMPPGSYLVRVRRADGKIWEKKVEMTATAPLKVMADFEAAGAAPPAAVGKTAEPPEEPPAGGAGMPWSARPSGKGHGAISAFSGYPFPIGVQVTGGVLDRLDVGLAIRSSFDVITEFEALGKYTFVQGGNLSFAGEFGLGFGLGGRERNSFLTRLTALGSLAIGSRAAITARVGVNFFTDRTGPESDANHKERDDTFQMRLGLSVDVRVSDSMNVFLLFEGDPITNGRKILDESFLSEVRIYGKLGVSWIF